MMSRKIVSLPIGGPPLKRKREVSWPPTRKSRVNSLTSQPSPSANQRRLVAWFENAANTRAGGDGYTRSMLKVLWTTELWSGGCLHQVFPCFCVAVGGSSSASRSPRRSSRRSHSERRSAIHSAATSRPLGSMRQVRTAADLLGMDQAAALEHLEVLNDHLGDLLAEDEPPTATQKQGTP